MASAETSMVVKTTLKHSCHEHALTLRMLSENGKLNCSLCELNSSGPTYCCDNCDYFLHQSCALIELPSRLWHPSHQRHPLSLSGDKNDHYSCSHCNVFPVHVKTAIATLPPLELTDDEEEIFSHFAHHHILVSFRVESPLLTRCEGCGRRISGQVYGCRECLFLLHESCVRYPEVLIHPFWSKLTLTLFRQDVNSYLPEPCLACGHSLDHRLVYKGQKDESYSFSLHTACTLSITYPPISSTDAIMAWRFGTEWLGVFTQTYSWHPCSLALLHILDEDCVKLRCKACELWISGEALVCFKCRFFLHKSCAEKLSEVICHFLHPDHPALILEYQRGVVPQCLCLTCRGTDSYDHPRALMAFQCNSCRFYLNPNCALQTLAAVEDGAAPSIQHFAHDDHPLLLHFARPSKYDDCIACKQGIQGLVYCCVKCEPVRLHKSCAELPQEVQHPFHPQHPLLLLAKASAGYFSCRACHDQFTGFAYYCAKCEYYLDIGCASLDLTLKHPRHEHSLAYFNETKDDCTSCNACGKRCKRDLYLCLPCGFRIHHGCRPLPPMTELTRCAQRHPLFLREQFVDGDPNDQYCDICEEQRNPDHGVYCCEECPFYAHIDCAIPNNKVEVEEKETRVEVEGTEEESGEESEELTGTISKRLVLSQANSMAGCLESRIAMLRRNIDTMKGNIEASLKQLKELEIERDTLAS